jgi:hypothetical protein
MTAQYKTWEGKWPFVILLDGEDVFNVLYYETGFEQLHPQLHIHTWMEERNQQYQDHWKVVRVDEDRSRVSEWAVCFQTSEMRDMFALKWI